MIIGYARISSGGDHALAQCEALKDAGCESIIVEKTKGAVIDQPKLEKLLSSLTEGDVLTVTRLDRLGLSLMQLNELIKELVISLADHVTPPEPRRIDRRPGRLPDRQCRPACRAAPWL